MTKEEFIKILATEIGNYRGCVEIFECQDSEPACMCREQAEIVTENVWAKLNIESIKPEPGKIVEGKDEKGTKYWHCY